MDTLYYLMLINLVYFHLDAIHSLYEVSLLFSVEGNGLGGGGRGAGHL